MSGSLSQLQREQIMKQYQEELDALERAIAKERDNQLTKMRQKLVKRRIEQERFRKEEQQQKQIADIKGNVKNTLKQMIAGSQSNSVSSTQRMEAKPAMAT